MAIVVVVDCERGGNVRRGASCDRDNHCRHVHRLAIIADIDQRPDFPFNSDSLSWANVLDPLRGSHYGFFFFFFFDRIGNISS